MEALSDRVEAPVEETKAERRARIYMDRKLRQVCVHCEAGLQPDDGVYCFECAEIDRAGHARRSRTPEGRKSNAVRQRAYYDECVAAKICPGCRAVPRDGKIFCPDCAKAKSEATQRYKLRKKTGAPLVDLRLRAIPIATPARDVYMPLDERLEYPRVRILRALRFLGWVTSWDLFDHLGIEQVTRDNPSPERDRYFNALSRLARRWGSLDRRGTPGQYEYNINARGIAELARTLAAEGAS